MKLEGSLVRISQNDENKLSSFSKLAFPCYLLSLLLCNKCFQPPPDQILLTLTCSATMCRTVVVE
jgi:hypothetical protein